MTWNHFAFGLFHLIPGLIFNKIMSNTHRGRRAGDRIGLNTTSELLRAHMVTLRSEQTGITRLPSPQSQLSLFVPIRPLRLPPVARFDFVRDCLSEGAKLTD